MKFGMHYWHRESPSQLHTDAKRVEDGRFDFMGLVDTQLLFRDVYSSLSLAANATSSLSIGPMVTNPVTRHPSVTASAICSISELTEGKVRLGIGTGHSSVASIGKSPAKLKEIEKTINNIRTLCAGEIVEEDNTSYQLEWVNHIHDQIDVPIILAAEGPKTQRLAGKIADGVVFNGPDPDLVSRSVERITAGAEAAGRDPNEIEKWVKVRANVAEDRSLATKELRTPLADYGSVMLKNKDNRDLLPPEYSDQIERFIANYDSHNGYYAENEGTAAILDELNLTEIFAEHFAIVGTADDCIDQLQHLSRCSVDGVLMATELDVQEKFIQKMGTDVIPYFD